MSTSPTPASVPQADPHPSAPPASAPYTLHFARWECGHHQERPADIPVHTLEQAELIAHAIAGAISQPGSAEAWLLSDTRGVRVYLTDDYARFGGNENGKAPCDLGMWAGRPVVIHGDAATIDHLHAPALLEAVEWVLCVNEIERWDGVAHVTAAVVTTTLSPDAIATAVRPIGGWGQDLASPFDLPPVLRPAAEVLLELQAEANDNADDQVEATQEGGTA